MKTINIFKNTTLPIILIAVFSFMAINISAQEEERKTVRIKVVKDVDGETTITDTTFSVSDIEDIEGIEGIEDIDVKLKELDENEDVDVEVITVEKEGDSEIHTIIVKTKVENEDGMESEIIETIDLIVDVDDEDADGKVVKMTMDGESHVVYISEDEDIQEIETEDGKTIIIKKTMGDDEDILIMHSEDLNWEDEMKIDVEIDDVEGGQKVTIKDENGEVKEYLIEGGEGAYFIDEDGNVNKIDDDENVLWNEDREGVFVNIEEDGGENVIILKGSESGELDNDKNIFIHQNSGVEDKEVFIEVIRKQDGDEIIEIKSKVIIVSLNEEESEKLEEAGVKVGKADNENILEVESLKFYPNPTDGKFNLKFKIAEKGTTEIKIYDVNGKKVYSEKLKNFEGQYEKEIDLTGEPKGTYFLHIQQGDKISTRKIVLE